MDAKRVRPAIDIPRLHAVALIFYLQHDPVFALRPRHHPQVEREAFTKKSEDGPRRFLEIVQNKIRHDAVLLGLKSIASARKK